MEEPSIKDKVKELKEWVKGFENGVKELIIKYPQYHYEYQRDLDVIEDLKIKMDELGL